MQDRLVQFLSTWHEGSSHAPNSHVVCVNRLRGRWYVIKEGQSGAEWYLLSMSHFGRALKPPFEIPTQIDEWNLVNSRYFGPFFCKKIITLLADFPISLVLGASCSIQLPLLNQTSFFDIYNEFHVEAMRNLCRAVKELRGSFSGIRMLMRNKTTVAISWRNAWCRPLHYVN